ncbi:hypothetical protein AND4_14316 [Vibrio sp. AND4]|nr:hypothetical protein AND4_14316 [Vibrio sp. AND4]
MYRLRGRGHSELESGNLVVLQAGSAGYPEFQSIWF